MLLADGRTGIIPLTENTTLRFTHVSIPRPLLITTGASAIQWSYVLNTNIIPTYGGEVGQILSAYVDAITITGQTKDNDQLKEIYEWFLDYMQLAGLNLREQQAVKFEYAERGWSFYIQPRLAENFEYNRDKIALPWTIVAEVVADNDLNYLSGYTMSVMGESVTFDPSLYDIGFNVEQPGQQPNFGATLAQNFQSLLGAWATGDFAHWGFDVLKSPTANNLSPDAAQIFDQAFGSDFVAGRAAHVGGLGGASTYSGPTNPTSKLDVVALINATFESNGMPGKLGVATVMNEDGSFNPNVRQSGGPGIGLFQVSGDGSGRVGPSSSGVLGAHWSNLHAAFLDTAHPVTVHYGSSMQIDDAATWFKGYRNSDLGTWAANAQAPADPTGYAARIRANLPAAQNLIDQAASAGGQGSTKAMAAVLFAKQQIGQPYVWGGTGRGTGGFDCSGLCFAAYQSAGLTIPRTSDAQWAAPYQKVTQANLHMGDLIYFDTHDGQPAPSHVVLYIGFGKVIAAPHRGTNVQIETLSSLVSAYGFFGANRPAP